MIKPEDLTRLTNKTPRRRKPKDEQEELMELNEELLANRPALDFATYQREVGKVTTPSWPIKVPDEVFKQIIWHASSAIHGDQQALVVQTAAILRHLAELCDYVPISLERVAHISLSEIPQMPNELGTQSSEVKKIS